jgi:hypothetical protein
MLQRSFIGACVLSLVLLGAFRSQAADAPDIVRVLHDWQHASTDVPAPTIDGDLARYAATHSAHELEAAAALCGPVSARALIEQFEWTAAATDAGTVVLTGVPRDELGRLFFSAVEIEFAADSPRPRELRFRDSEKQLRPVAITVPMSDADSAPELLQVGTGLIQLASLVEFAVDDSEVADQPIADVLAAWADATRNIERAEIEFVRYQYDHIFGVEKRGEGRFHFEHPDRGVYEIRASDVAADAESRRTAADGSPLKVEADKPLIGYWENQHVVVAHPEQHAYDEFAVPRSSEVRPAGSFDRLWYSLATPQRTFPATVDVHSGAFLERFEWSLLNHDEQRLILQGRPVTDEDQLEISELQVILDPATHLPQATRLISGDGHQETVHVIRRFAVNDAVPETDWRPDLNGYAECNPAPLAPPAEEE